MVGKQAVFRTLEALVAIFITFLFLLVFIPQQREQSFQQPPANVLAGLRNNDEFRNCILQKNSTCINQSIERQLEDKYDFKFNISGNPREPPPQLPQKRVYTNAFLIAGNTTNVTNTAVRLYFWEKR
ncbi:TPA: hypothetical protein HA231_00780 [Candidatus Woesearchaeota archaeon]|nr:hypothetical protein [Candidatus Woesearchaeota archaeon]